MNVTQLSIFIENKPGHLQHVLKILSEEHINIITLTIAESSDYGVLRLIVNNPDKGLEILKKYHITSSITDVLAIEIDDKPGSLLKAIDTFTRRNLNIEYMYAFTQKRGDRAVMIFRFDNMETAKNALKEEGYAIVSRKDITGE